VEATRRALTHLKGAHGIVVMSLNEPDKIVAARIGNAGGVVIGIGEGEMFVASDMPAILDHTRKIVFLESRQMAVVTRRASKYRRSKESRSTTRCIQYPGILSRLKKANTAISCTRRSTSRCAH
jgi:glucosamine 6-phosphate synthetase-like amidotransferase/phosphosugar isomerase protein